MKKTSPHNFSDEVLWVMSNSGRALARAVEAVVFEARAVVLGGSLVILGVLGATLELGPLCTLTVSDCTSNACRS